MGVLAAAYPFEHQSAEAVLIGSPPLPPLAAAAGDVARAVGHRVTLTLLYTERSRFEVRSAASRGGSW